MKKNQTYLHITIQHKWILTIYSNHIIYVGVGYIDGICKNTENAVSVSCYVISLGGRVCESVIAYLFLFS